MTEPEPTERAPGKGRPTPKRSEAERRRRQPVTAPTNRKEAARARRAQERERRAAARGALRTGDERNLPPRDSGPVKRYVRDLVDSRRNAGNYVLVIAFLILVLGSVRVPIVQLVLAFLYPAILIAVVVDTVLLVRLIKRRVAAAYPDEPLRGLGVYAGLRAFQIRRLRLPPPKVKLGEEVRPAVRR